MKQSFKRKKVTVMGLGLHGGGVEAAKFFCKKGAKVLVTDLKEKEKLQKSIEKLKDFDVEYALGKHKKENFINADLIVKNPDVPKDSPFLKIAEENKVPVETDVNLFLERIKNNLVIGVTGTKGKSTVSTLIYKILKKEYPETILAGNIGISPLKALENVKKNTKIVLELSSFSLENVKKSPNIAVVTNIYPDHLNKYKNLKEYVGAKKRIFKFQDKKNSLVLNYDNSKTKNFSKETKSNVIFFSSKKILSKGCFIKDNWIFFNDKKIINLKNLKLTGEHNISNILASVSVAKILNISTDSIKKALISFEGVKNREELVDIKNDIKYINDTTSTMPESTIFSVKNLKEKFPDSRIVLIGGGEDKNVNYERFSKEIDKNVSFFIVFPGSASEKIKDSLKKIKPIKVGSMEEAVKKSSDLAQKGDIVLLSPGAASFNMFQNEFDRGDQFNEEVKKI